MPNTGPAVVGTVGALARYPVKSTAGQALSVAAVSKRGLDGDREWAAYTPDGGMASGKTSQRFRKVDGLLGWRSTLGTSDGPPELHSPDGASYPVDDPAASEALVRAFGQPLELRYAPMRAHDECGVHLVTTSALRRVQELVAGPLDARRLRANIVLDTEGEGFVEDDWIGADLAIGPRVVLRLGVGMPRCRMVDLPQAGVAADAPMLQALGRHHDVALGLQADVMRTGTISVGDQARLLRH